MIYIVLGMHKSGTTLVSQTLHHSGIKMGDDFDEALGYRHNKYEWREPYLVNLQLLAAAEDTYFSLDYYKPRTAPPSPSIEKNMREIIQRRQAEKLDWGFKEPLTCLTYPLWAQQLPMHKLICVYRSPSQVIRHYKANALSLHRGFRALRAWSSYNTAMLNAIHSQPNQSILLRYEELMAGNLEFNRLEKFVQKRLNDRRRDSEFHGRVAHPLFKPLDLLMPRDGLDRPSEILRRLDEARELQISNDQPRSS